MKNLKNVCKLLPVLLLMLLASCKKDNNNDAQKNIGNDELLNYYFTVQLNTGQKLRIIYFKKEGNDVQATLDAVSSRRVQTISVNNNSFSFDVNADGKVVYNFVLSKDNDGNISLGSYSYKNQDDATVQIVEAHLYKSAEVPSYKQTGFANSVPPYVTLGFSGSNVSLQGVTAPYYEIAPGAWKATINGADYMGVTIPSGKNTAKTMLVQKAGSDVLTFLEI